MSRHSDMPPNTERCAVRIVDAKAVDDVRRTLAPDRSVESTVAIFSALADPTRFRILDALSKRELCVCDLAELAGVSESATSHQLRLLRDRGLVTSRRDKQRAVYRLADDHVRALLATGLEHAAEGDRR